MDVLYQLSYRGILFVLKKCTTYREKVPVLLDSSLHNLAFPRHLFRMRGTPWGAIDR